jgi:hypothetical protein
MGVSESFARMKSPTPTSTMLKRNGILHPQAANCASESAETSTRKMPAESR